MSLAIIIAITGPACAEDGPSVGGADNADMIVVSGNRLEKTARLEQRRATELVDIQPIETMQKYPDINAAESLARMPGVTIDIDESEGRLVNIRGIDGDLNGATFGGASMLNTFPNATQFNKTGRAVLFNSIPSGVIDRMVVTKSWTPEQQADGIGGSVELTPRSAMGHDRFFVEGHLGGGIETEQGKALFDDSVAVGGGFGKNADGDALFHAVVSQSQRNDRRGFDDVEENYADKPGILGGAFPEDKAFKTLEYRHYRYSRHRYGYSADIDFTPDSRNLFFVRGALMGINEHVNRQLFQFAGLNGSAGTLKYDPANPDAFVATGASLNNIVRDRAELSRNLIVQGGGKHEFGEFKIDWMASYVRSSFNNPYDRISTFTGPSGLTIGYNNIADSNRPTATVAGGVNIADPSLYTLHDIQNSAELARDSEYSYRLNISKPLHLFANDALKIGGMLRYRNKWDMKAANSLVMANPTTGVGTGPALSQLQGLGPVDNFYDGLANIGYEPDLAAIASRYGAQVATVPFNLANPATLVFNDHENIAAGYIQYGGDIGALHFLAGVRVETTKQTLGGVASQTFVDSSGTTIPANSIYAPSKTYTYAFPSLHLTYTIRSDIQLRASYSTSIARPGFFQTEAKQTINIGSFTINKGNPDLKPSYANNFDLGLYYYLPHSGILSVSLFYKKISNFIASRAVTQSVTVAGLSHDYLVSSYFNVNGTWARGIEANYVQKFTALPGILGGLGVDLNAMFAGSKVNLKSGLPSQMIPGMSAFVGNASLFYEGHGLNLRLALNHLSSTLYSIGGGHTNFSYASIPTDIYLAARTSLDASASYDVTPRVNLYWSVKNITDTPLYGYEGLYRRPIHREYYGQTYEAGVRFKI